VAAGLAHRLGIDPVLVRVAFGVLSMARGAGVILYLLLWAISHEEEPAPVEARSGARQIIAIACITGGLLLGLREVGWWFGDAVVWPLATAALGSTFVWARADDGERARWASSTERARPWDSPGSVLRLVIGFGLVIAGTAAVLRAYSPVGLNRVALPVTVAIVGLLLALGPWLLRLSKQLREERGERIRADERSAISAHLHDSVLQTLAMIQRTGSHQEVTALARRQERELRAWLYSRSIGTEQATLRASLEATAARVEEMHRVPIETVIVGDGRMDERLRVAVQAAGEAMNNAALHSGASVITVYAEVEPASVTVYVRDQGKGFDVDSTPTDRRGIADSIVGRVTRQGGTTEINSEIGTGTEVKIVLPLGAAARRAP
jgi:signal transduction histidine kinase/phage shock protein PspC (stress-responsive transcriptional regulator)